MPLPSSQSPAVRDRIVRAGLETFGERGFAATTTTAIARAARVTKPMIYYYFGSKDGLLRALLEVAVAATQRRLAPAEGEETTHDRLLGLCRRAAELAEEQPGLLRFLAACGRPDATLRTLRPDASQSAFACVERILDAGVARGEIRADVDLALFAGLVRVAVTTLVESAKPAEALVQLLLEGARVSSDRPNE